ncbi:MAG TPA: hypothetical protein VI958_12365, partial [Acidobacteriota bacterium]
AVVDFEVLSARLNRPRCLCSTGPDRAESLSALSGLVPKARRRLSLAAVFSRNCQTQRDRFHR